MFEVGDRVKFTDEFLQENAGYIDPAITDEECQGTVVEVGDKITVRFNDGQVDSYHPDCFTAVSI